MAYQRPPYVQGFKKIKSETGKTIGPTESTHTGSLIRLSPIQIPEILENVFTYLDFYTVKQARLVSKIWVYASNFQFSRETVVHLDLNTSRLTQFSNHFKTRLNCIPSPFASVSLLFDASKTNKFPFKELPCLDFLGVSLTAFNTCGIPLHLCLNILKKYNETLQKLEIHCELSSNASNNILWCPPACFKNLRHISVLAATAQNQLNNFSEIVVQIVSASPGLITFESSCQDMLLGNQIIKFAKLEMIKNLILGGNAQYCVNAETVKHLQNIHFKRLEYLKLAVIVSGNYVESKRVSEDCLRAILRQANKSNSLTKLDIPGFECPENMEGFPICPLVKTVSILRFSRNTTNLLASLPSVSQLNIRVFDFQILQNSNMPQAPLLNITKLSICTPILGLLSQSLFVTFFKLFPKITDLTASVEFFLRCCYMKAKKNHQYRNVLQSVRHITVHRRRLGSVRISETTSFSHFRFFFVLTCLKTLKFSSFLQVLHLPLDNLPGLQMIMLPWLSEDEKEIEDEQRITAVLLNLAKWGKTVMLLDCCVIRRNRNSTTSQLMLNFLARTPNALCGCRKNITQSSSERCCDFC